jgi:hypothetical protein
MSKIEKNKIKNYEINEKNEEKEVKKVKLLLDNLIYFLAELPVDKYHDYRNFRNLRLRGSLINKFMRDRDVRQIRGRKNHNH